jgi:hypothetical protein
MYSVVSKRSKIEQLLTEISATETLLIEQLKAGVPIAPGLLTARIKGQKLVVELA